MQEACQQEASKVMLNHELPRMLLALYLGSYVSQDFSNRRMVQTQTEVRLDLDLRILHRLHRHKHGHDQGCAYPLSKS